MSNLNGEVEVHKKMETTIGNVTALKKIKRRKIKNNSPDLGGTRENTQEVKCNEAVSSKTTIPDANMLSKEHDCTTDGKTETTDLNVNGKGEREKKPNRRLTLAEILNPQYSESLEVIKGEPGSGTTSTDNQESKIQKRQNINKNSDLGDFVSTRESTHKGLSTTKVVEVKNGESISAKTATPDENMVSKEQDHTEVANGKMGESETTDLNVNIKNKKKKEPNPKNKRPTLGEILNPSYLQNLDASKSERASGSTSTYNPVSKKVKRNLKKNSYSSDILRTSHESTHEVLCAAKVLEVVVSKGDHIEVANGKKKKKRKLESKNKLPTLGENLNPMYLQNMEAADIQASGDICENTSKVVEAVSGGLSQGGKCMEYAIGDMSLRARNNLDVTDVRKEETKLKGLVKKLLILDVNGLLVDVSSDRPKDVIADKHMHGQAIFKRPYLDDFLHFCFQRFNVAIWSSRTMITLAPLVYFLFRDLRWKLLFVWDGCECTDSDIDTLEVKHKHVVVKDLRKIWDADGPNNKWVKGTFNESNTLLVDDSPYKGLLNPKYTGIFPASYSYKNSDDNFLGPKGELQTYLEGLAAADDVRTYVGQHPFGQGVIDEQNPHWEFYSSVLERLNNEPMMKRLLKKNRWKRKKNCHGYQKRKRRSGKARENTQGLSTTKALEVKNDETVSVKIATPDANMVLKEQDHTEVANGKKKRKRKLESKNKLPSLGENLNPMYSQNMEAADIPASGDICENTSKVVEAVSGGLSQGGKRMEYAIGDMSLRERNNLDVTDVRKEETKLKGLVKKLLILDVNGLLLDISSDRPKDVIADKHMHGRASRNQKGSCTTKVLKVKSDETVLAKTVTIDANMVSKEDHSEIANGETGESEITNLNVSGMKKRKREPKSMNKQPVFGENLDPLYLQNLEAAKHDNLASNEQKRQKINDNSALGDILSTCENTSKVLQAVNAGVSQGEEHMKDANGSMGFRANTNFNVIDVGKEETEPKVLEKKLIILDVNVLLADVVSDLPNDIIADKYITRREIFKRPYVHEFLSFCFERFHVGIWSSRTMRNLVPVVNFLLGDLKKKLLFLWDGCKCTDSGIGSLDVQYKNIVVKDLRKIWDEDGPNNLWAKGTFNESNTLLVDDSPYKGLLNPKYTGIFLDSYSCTNSDDNFLGPNGELQTYLDGLAAADDVKTYVEQHPFGQGVIDEQNPDWVFYSSLIEHLNNKLFMERLAKENQWKEEDAANTLILLASRNTRI